MTDTKEEKKYAELVVGKDFVQIGEYDGFVEAMVPKNSITLLFEPDKPIVLLSKGVGGARPIAPACMKDLVLRLFMSDTSNFVFPYILLDLEDSDLE